MTTDLALSVVIPAFNESAHIGQTLADLSVVLDFVVPTWEIRVVDDGSADDTADRVAALSRADRRIVLQREPHRGKGGTMKAGLLASRGQRAFMCDADLSMPARELPRLLELVPASCDVAIASREAPGARRVGEPPYRHWTGRAFNTLVRASLLPGVQDSQCGFKLFTRRAVEAIFPLVTVEGWAFDVEVLYIARWKRLVVAEVPIEWHYRPDSRVSMARDAWRMTRDLLAIRRAARLGRYGDRTASSDTARTAAVR